MKDMKCNQFCTYNTLNGCMVEERNSICPLSIINTAVKNYIIINVDCVVKTYLAENVKEAICKYAEYCGLKIALTIFEKAVQNLELIEIIDLFNQNCLSDSDKIERIFTGYTTLYDEHK